MSWLLYISDALYRAPKERGENPHIGTAKKYKRGEGVGQAVGCELWAPWHNLKDQAVLTKDWEKLSCGQRGKNQSKPKWCQRCRGDANVNSHWVGDIWEWKSTFGKTETASMGCVAGQSERLGRWTVKKKGNKGPILRGREARVRSGYLKAWGKSRRRLEPVFSCCCFFYDAGYWN